MININNLFNFCNESIDCPDVLFKVGENFANTVLILAINNEHNFIYKYSNEWLYLISNYYPNDFYNHLINFYYGIVNHKVNVHIIHDEAISFITSFSTGTVHGYSGLFYIISEYLNNIDLYKNKKILVLKNSQKGMLDIIEHLCNKGVINRDTGRLSWVCSQAHESSVVI